MPDKIETLWSLIGAYRGSAVVNALVATGLTDALYQGECDSEALAQALDLDPVRTLQLLRAAAVFDLVQHEGGHRFSLSAMGEHLATQAPRSMAGPAKYFAGVSALAFAGLEAALHGGPSAFDRMHGQSFYSLLGSDPEISDAYNELIAIDGLGRSIARTRSFHQLRHVVDLGGGRGRTLAELLREHHHLQGTLVDLPHAVAQVDEAAANHEEWTGADVASRFTVMPGNFLEDVPEGGDLYLICRVLPNLSDEDTERLLSNCAHAMAPGASLMIVDMETPEVVAAGDFRSIGDLQAMAHFGGRIRTRLELTEVLEKAGLTVTTAHEMPAFPGFVAVEAERNGQ